MSAGAILGGASIGAGVGVSSVALAPFNAANTFMGSAFFGYGMILGERYMYQADWPKIQARLEHGEKIENIIQEYTGVFTAVVMKEAKIIFDTVTREFISIMSEALRGLVPEGPEIRDDAPTIGDPRRPRSPGVPAPTPEPITTPITVTTPQPTENKYTQQYARQYASGRVMNNVGSQLFYLHTNLKPGTVDGLWRSISSGTFSKMTAAAMASWPSSGYKQIIVKHVKTNQNIHYWFLNKY